MSQFDDLQFMLLTHRLEKQNDEPIDTTIVLEQHPLEKFLARDEFEKAGGPKDWNWDEPITSGADSLRKSDDVAVANRMGISTAFGSAATLAESTRTEQLEKRDDPAISDGTEVEECGKQTWKYVYKGGKCVRMECEDPDLPGSGRLYFDGDGNELTT